MQQALQSAIRQWQEAIGSEHVHLDQRSQQQIATTTFLTSHQVPAIIKPKSREEVQRCIRIANNLKVPVYVVSTGKNWGNGSAVPVQDECVVMHLGRMNRIPLEGFNRNQAYATVEPGVTQGQLAEFLRRQQADLWVDVTGSSPECSLIGNIMERGHGHSAYSNRVSHISHLEVVLPNGDCIETGFGKYDNACASPVYPWGVGPSLDGLFTQSNLGIVTRATIWLMPKPEKIECFYFSVQGEEQLEQVIDALQPLRLRGVLNSAIHIGNNYKVLNTYQQYPWNLTNGRTPLPVEVLKTASENVGCGDWNGSGALYGTRSQISDAKRQLRRALKGKVTRLNFMTDNTLSIAKRFPKIIGKFLGLNLESLLPVIESIYGMQKGIPSDVAMASTYWRKKQPPPESKDPDRDRCGLIWYSPVAPLEGRHASAIFNTAKKIMLLCSFEPLVSVVFVSERVLCCVISILYDREVPGEDQKAMECHAEIVADLAELGYYPYRLGIQNMAQLPPTDANYVNLIHNIKTTFDPNHILSPGRYEF